MTRLGTENIICAATWQDTELHQNLNWYTRAYSHAQALIPKLQTLHGPHHTAYICDTFKRPDAETYMQNNGFTIIKLNCGHTPQKYTLDYPQ